MTYALGERKYSVFLIAVLGGITILSVPLISNHFFHSDHIFHTTVHEVGFVLAAFLTVIAIISYKKKKIGKCYFHQLRLVF